MKAMILAAGRVERMRPLTDRVPKALLEVGGKSLIAWQIERLAAAGIDDIVINYAHLGALIEAALGDGARFGVRIAYSREAEPLDTAGGVANALPLLGVEPFLLISSDVHSDCDYSRLAPVAEAMRHDGRLAHLLLLDATPPPPYDFALAAGDTGLIVRKGAPGLTFAGIAAFSPMLFSNLERGAKAPLLPLLCDAIAGGRASGEVFRGRLENLTTPAQLAALDRRLRA
jgi:MurNAc alpha-1-phosphate uridylyltransferase